MMGQNNKQFIDVRTAGEYRGNNIKGFRNIPLNELANKAQQLDKQKEVIVLCQSGMRSKQAAKVLKKIRISARYQCFRRYEWFVRRKCKMKEMTAKELEEKLLRKEAVNIVDVREVEEVAAGKIPEACNIPLGLLEFRMHELDKKERVYYRLSFWRKKCTSCSIFRELRFSSDQYGRWYVSVGR